MNPGHGQRSPSGLSPLQHVAVHPERYSQGTAAIASLRKIASLRVESAVQRDGALYYVIDVYLDKPASRIPTNASPRHTMDSSVDSDRAPDLRVERRFSEFTKLRSEAYYLAQTSHNLLRCSFCHNIVNSTLLGSDQPKSYMNLLLTRRAIAPILTEFLRGLLKITLSSRRTIDECAARERSPHLLLAFLHAPQEERIESHLGGRYS